MIPSSNVESILEDDLIQLKLPDEFYIPNTNSNMEKHTFLNLKGISVVIPKISQQSILDVENEFSSALGMKHQFNENTNELTIYISDPYGTNDVLNKIISLSEQDEQEDIICEDDIPAENKKFADKLFGLLESPEIRKACQLALTNAHAQREHHRSSIENILVSLNTFLNCESKLQQLTIRKDVIDKISKFEPDKFYPEEIPILKDKILNLLKENDLGQLLKDYLQNILLRINNHQDLITEIKISSSQINEHEEICNNIRTLTNKIKEYDKDIKYSSINQPLQHHLDEISTENNKISKKVSELINDKNINRFLKENLSSLCNELNIQIKNYEHSIDKKEEERKQFIKKIQENPIEYFDENIQNHPLNRGSNPYAFNALASQHRSSSSIKSKTEKMNQTISEQVIVITDKHKEQINRELFSKDNLIDSIKFIGEIARKQHLAKMALEKNQNDKNYITTLITNEFFFYNKNQSLSKEEFDFLCHKLEELGGQYPENVFLVLSSFPVEVPERTIHVNSSEQDKESVSKKRVINCTIHLQCGKSPKITTINKAVSAGYDYAMSNLDPSGYNIEIDKLPIADKTADFLVSNESNSPVSVNFDHCFECETAGGAKFFRVFDICLDHAYKKGKSDFIKHLIQLRDTGEPIPEQVSQIVTSNIMTTLENAAVIPLHQVTIADPVASRGNTLRTLDTYSSPSEEVKGFIGNQVKADELSFKIPNRSNEYRVIFREVHQLATSNISKKIALSGAEKENIQPEVAEENKTNIYGIK